MESPITLVRIPTEYTITNARKNKLTLAIDEFFVLGDNRNSSEDSRSGNISGVKKDNILFL